MVNFSFIWDSVAPNFAAGYTLIVTPLVWSELKAHRGTFYGCF